MGMNTMMFLHLTVVVTTPCLRKKQPKLFLS